MAFELLSLSPVETFVCTLPTTYVNVVLPNFIESNISNVVVSPVLNAPQRSVNIEIDPIPFWVSSLRIDYLNRLYSSGACPPPPPVISQPVGTVVQTAGILLSQGFYYRIPIDTGTTLNGQPVPKYLNTLTYPFSAYVYDDKNTYFGSMLVKSLTDLGSVAPDVTVLTHDEVIAELIQDVNFIFAL